jgi:hypothetical protein
MADYGPLASIVAYGGNLTAGALALRVAWAGKLAFEPPITSLEKASTRFAGVIAAVTIGIIFALTRGAGDWRWVVNWALISAVVALIGLLAYTVLLQTLVVRCPNDARPYLAGFWLTPRAKQTLAGQVGCVTVS